MLASSLFWPRFEPPRWAIDVLQPQPGQAQLDEFVAGSQVLSIRRELTHCEGRSSNLHTQDHTRHIGIGIGLIQSTDGVDRATRVIDAVGPVGGAVDRPYVAIFGRADTHGFHAIVESLCG